MFHCPTIVVMSLMNLRTEMITVVAFKSFKITWTIFVPVLCLYKDLNERK